MRKVELDITKEAEIRPATEFVKKYKLPAVVVSPELVTSASIARALARNQHKIITMVDWPKGTQHLANKFRGMPSESLKSDGFEILLTPVNTPNIRKEIRFLSDFFIEHFPPTIELRMVLGWYGPGREEKHFEDMLEILKTIPSPQMVRLTHLTKLNSTNSSIEAHRRIIDKTKSLKKIPIKISGNITMHIRAACDDVDRFGCTLTQAKALQKGLSDKGLVRIKEELAESNIK